MVVGNKIKAYVQKKVREVDSMGGWVEFFEDIDIIFGHLSVTDGDSEPLYNKDTVVSTHIFRCDYHKHINEENRIRIGNRYYDILYVEDVDFMHIQTKIFLRGVLGTFGK